MELVSAVITTHNRKALLERAVKSVLAQTYENMELIIIDDASSDDTQQYCTELSRNNEKIRYVHIPKAESRGGNYARNLGIENARGEWIAFLDDDDEWLPEKTQKQMDYLAAHDDIRAVSSDLVYVYVFGDKQYCHNSNLQINGKALDFFVTSWLNVTSTMIIHKEVLTEIGGFDEKLKAIQEVELAYRVCMACKVGIVKEPLINYYQYPNSKNQVTNSVDKYLTALDYVEKKHKDMLDQLDDEQKARLEMARVSNIAVRYLRVDRRKEYRKTIKPQLKNAGLKQKLEFVCSYFMTYKQIVSLECFLKKLSK